MDKRTNEQPTIEGMGPGIEDGPNLGIAGSADGTGSDPAITDGIEQPVKRSRGRPRKSDGPTDAKTPKQVLDSLDGKTSKTSKNQILTASDIAGFGVLIFSQIAAIRGNHWLPNTQALELISTPIANRLDKLPKNVKGKIEDSTDAIFLVIGLVMLLSEPIKTEIELSKQKKNENKIRSNVRNVDANNGTASTNGKPATVVTGVSSGLPEFPTY
jgi:hypothetical protein